MIDTINEKLFDKIAVTVAVGIEQRTGSDRMNGILIAKMTRDIFSAFREELPELIDLDQKWEGDSTEGVYVNLTGHEDLDARQLDYLAGFSHDKGYNNALITLRNQLTFPLNKPNKSAIVE